MSHSLRSVQANFQFPISNELKTYSCKVLSFFYVCEKLILDMLHGFFMGKPSVMSQEFYSILLGMEGNFGGYFLNSKSIHSQGIFERSRFLDYAL